MRHVFCSLIVAGYLVQTTTPFVAGPRCGDVRWLPDRCSVVASDEQLTTRDPRAVLKPRSDLPLAKEFSKMEEILLMGRRSSGIDRVRHHKPTVSVGFLALTTKGISLATYRISSRRRMHCC